MSNETKRDVLKKALDFLVMSGIERSTNYDMERYQYLSEYDSALPDNLPVIPELIGKYLIMRKHDRGDLVQALDEGTSFLLDGTQWESVQDWFWFSDVKDSVDTFARAWVLGAWKVEETGEVVKL
ncbi:hypothetical protein CPZ13_00175 [Lacticaseibacillus paracasei]|nr:hypothetical protein [Lacticaseibacillus paracasei]PCL24458.1 hypothetical protein CPZ14_00185 [Lacticaseibacillus paracasei]PCL35265.1 hypothetical protein CPZ13_00175 [Lacticaseibacillus paracasei]WRM21247.1 hypothetical protein T1M39_06080 [Lacticaseibacillus paracasei]